MMVNESVFKRVLTALGETPAFAPGDQVRVGSRAPIGHYRVPTYLRGKVGNRRHYYRISVPMTALWPAYAGSPQDELQIEVYESWLERMS
jgi:hypothetical protein